MLSSLKTSISRLVSVITAAVLLFAVSLCPQQPVKASQISQSQLNDMAEEVAYLVNEYRAENGLKPLYVVPFLSDAAQLRANENIVLTDHIRPDGSEFHTVVDPAVVPYFVVAENIAGGSDNAVDTMAQWKNSENHNRTLLEPSLTHIGVGVAYDKDSMYKYYWAQFFIGTDAVFEGQNLPQKYKVVPQSEGDITGDGIINTFDYLTLADYIYKKSQNTPVYFNDAQLKTADCFRDGIITESDAKVLVRYILGEYDTLPYIF